MCYGKPRTPLNLCRNSWGFSFLYLLWPLLPPSIDLIQIMSHKAPCIWSAYRACHFLNHLSGKFINQEHLVPKYCQMYRDMLSSELMLIYLLVGNSSDCSICVLLGVCVSVHFAKKALHGCRGAAWPCTAKQVVVLAWNSLTKTGPIFKSQPLSKSALVGELSS